jgi:hypothetical protein
MEVGEWYDTIIHDCDEDLNDPEATEEEKRYARKEIEIFTLEKELAVYLKNDNVNAAVNFYLRYMRTTENPYFIPAIFTYNHTRANVEFYSTILPILANEFPDYLLNWRTIMENAPERTVSRWFLELMNII